MAGFFGRNTNASNGLEVSVTMSNNGYHSDVVNKLLRNVIPKNAELADAIWEEAVQAVEEAKEETTELLVQNLRTISNDMPTDLG